MESRFRVLFLIVAMISLSGCAATKNLFGFDSREETSPTAERNRRLTAKTSKLVRLQGS
jgi:hypothetical protein